MTADHDRESLMSHRQLLLGVIADDFTGATDVASMLVRAGMRTVQVIGVPEGPAPQADAVVVALKTRTVPADQAIAGRSRLAMARRRRCATVLLQVLLHLRFDA